jgi:hypothetical protein
MKQSLQDQTQSAQQVFCRSASLENNLGRRFLEVILGDTTGETARKAYLLNNGVKHFHLTTYGSDIEKIYLALGSVVNERGKPTLETLTQKLNEWLEEPNAPSHEVTRDALETLCSLQTIYLNGQGFQTSIELAQAIKRQYKEANPDISPEEIEREAKSIKNPEMLKIRPPLQLLTLVDIFGRPRLEYLIQDILIERGTSVVTADYGAFKSFNVLDMGLCIATGKDWHGRKVKQGSVVYIIGEGAYTSADRIRAWLIRYRVEAPANFYMIEMPIQIANIPERSHLIAELVQHSPSLVIFDTLAKCNIGRDENASDAMGLFTHGMEEISRELNTHVMAVHHNNKAGTARGSTSLPANVDTHIVLEKSPGRMVTFKCDKQKGVPFEPFSLVGHIVELPETDEYGRPITSLVFDDTVAAAPLPKADETRRRVLDILRDAPNGLSAGKWQEKVREQVGCKESRFYDFVRQLKDEHIIDKRSGVWKLMQSTPITPIRSDYPKSERVINSDYSDDPLGSEQSEYSGAEGLTDAIFDDE